MIKPDVLVFGDLCPDNDYRQLFDNSPDGAFAPEVVAMMRKSALVIGNLECPATAQRKPLTKCGPNLRAKPQDIKKLKSCGFGVLSLANNHILDFCTQGVEDTLVNCRDAGIVTVGAGKDATVARRPAVVDVAGKRVGIASFAEAEFNLATETSPGANHFDPYSSFDDVRALSAQADYVIVLYHGGIEHYKYPSPLLQKKCRKFAECGADLVLCQHSHCIGTLEQFGNGTILYGQGNSLFGYRTGNSVWNEGLVAAVELDSQKITFKLLQARENGIAFATPEEAADRLERMRKDSEILNDTALLKEKWRDFCQSQASLDLPLLYGWGHIANKLNRMLGNCLFAWRYSKRKQMTTMNLLRCEAHHEVVQTILESRVFK